MSAVLFSALGRSPGAITAKVDALLREGKDIERVITFSTSEDIVLKGSVPLLTYEFAHYADYVTRGIQYEDRHIGNTDLKTTRAVPAEMASDGGPLTREGRMASEPNVFLNYAREDQAAVEALHDALSNAGMKPWMDVKNLLPGEQWEVAIRRALRGADFFVACLSSKAVTKRGYRQKELRMALDVWLEKLDEDIYLIPVHLEPCDAPDLLSRFQWLDLTAPDGVDRLIQAIHTGMARRTGSPPGP